MPVRITNISPRLEYIQSQIAEQGLTEEFRVWVRSWYADLPATLNFTGTELAQIYLSQVEAGIHLMSPEEQSRESMRALVEDQSIFACRQGMLDYALLGKDSPVIPEEIHNFENNISTAKKQLLANLMILDHRESLQLDEPANQDSVLKLNRVVHSIRGIDRELPSLAPALLGRLTYYGLQRLKEQFSLDQIPETMVLQVKKVKRAQKYKLEAAHLEAIKESGIFAKLDDIGPGNLRAIAELETELLGLLRVGLGLQNSKASIDIFNFQTFSPALRLAKSALRLEIIESRKRSQYLRLQKRADRYATGGQLGVGARVNLSRKLILGTADLVGSLEHTTFLIDQNDPPDEMVYSAEPADTLCKLKQQQAQLLSDKNITPPARYNEIMGTLESLSLGEPDQLEKRKAILIGEGYFQAYDRLTRDLDSLAASITKGVVNFDDNDFFGPDGSSFDENEADMRQWDTAIIMHKKSKQYKTLTEETIGGVFRRKPVNDAQAQPTEVYAYDWGNVLMIIGQTGGFRQLRRLLIDPVTKGARKYSWRDGMLNRNFGREMMGERATKHLIRILCLGETSAFITNDGLANIDKRKVLSSFPRNMAEYNILCELVEKCWGDMNSQVPIDIRQALAQYLREVDSGATGPVAVNARDLFAINPSSILGTQYSEIAAAVAAEQQYYFDPSLSDVENKLRLGYWEQKYQLTV